MLVDAGIIEFLVIIDSGNIRYIILSYECFLGLSKKFLGRLDGLLTQMDRENTKSTINILR